MTMTDQADDMIVPPMMAKFEWVWVLTRPRTKVSDSILVVEMDEKDGLRRRVVPVFAGRDDAAGLKGRLAPGGDYAEQAMRLDDVAAFAARNELEIMLLDETGVIIAHLEARLEQVPVH
jgi:hypothetical protein